MKILVIADMHGNLGVLGRVLEQVNMEGVDLVICPGDFTDMFQGTEDFSQMDVAELVLQRLLALGKPLLCVPGNQDPYEILGMFDEYGVNLHGRVVKFKGMNIMGWGGARTPFNTIFEPSEEETGEALESMGKEVGSRDFLLVVHDPPKDTKVDLIEEGKHVGSPVIRKFIEQRKPLLAISAHIHEAGGLDRIGTSQVFYPGPVFGGWYGVVNMDGKSVKCGRVKAKI